jgi:hypothetical protein
VWVWVRHGVLVGRRDLPVEGRVERRAVWVTSVALTVLEAAGALGADGSVLLDRVLRRVVGFDEVGRVHGRNVARHGGGAGGRRLGGCCGPGGVAGRACHDQVVAGRWLGRLGCRVPHRRLRWMSRCSTLRVAN